MIYSNNSIRESVQTNLRIDQLISAIKGSIENIVIGKIEVLEKINSGFELLKNEIHEPRRMKMLMDISPNKGNVTDYQIMFYLYSILTPEKLNSLRKWVTSNESIRASSKYNVKVVLNIYHNLIDMRKLYTKQLLYSTDETGNCTLTFEKLTSTIQKGVENILLDRGQKVPTKLIIGLLEVLKRELFYSNSTRMFSHEFIEADDLVMDFLYSMLSTEKSNILRIWLNRKEIPIIQNKQELGIITSIYVPDWHV